MIGSSCTCSLILQTLRFQCGHSLLPAITEGLCVSIFRKQYTHLRSHSVRQQYTLCLSRSEERAEPPCCLNVTVETSRPGWCVLVWKNAGKKGRKDKEGKSDRGRVLQSPSIFYTIRNYSKPLSKKPTGNLISALFIFQLPKDVFFLRLCQKNVHRNFSCIISPFPAALLSYRSPHHWVTFFDII